MTAEPTDKRPEGPTEETQEPEEQPVATAAAEDGQGEEEPRITDEDAGQIARQAGRSVSFRAVLKNPQVSTNSDSQDQFKVGLTVSHGNLYELHQRVKGFASSAVSVTLTPVPEEPTRADADQLDMFGDDGEAEKALVMCPDCSGSGIAIIGHEGDEDVEGACPACEGKGRIRPDKLSETTFRLVRCEKCGFELSTRNEDIKAGRVCPECGDGRLAFVEPPARENPERKADVPSGIHVTPDRVDELADAESDPCTDGIVKGLVEIGGVQYAITEITSADPVTFMAWRAMPLADFGGYPGEEYHFAPSGELHNLRVTLGGESGAAFILLGPALAIMAAATEDAEEHSEETGEAAESDDDQPEPDPDAASE